MVNQPGVKFLDDAATREGVRRRSQQFATEYGGSIAGSSNIDYTGCFRRQLFVTKHQVSSQQIHTVID